MLLLFGGGGGYYGYSRWGPRGGLGIVGAMAATIVVLLTLAFSGNRAGPVAAALAP
jgi:hypothetical protein